jgi:hypothetical protein
MEGAALRLILEKGATPLGNYGNFIHEEEGDCRGQTVCTLKAVCNTCSTVLLELVPGQTFQTFLG